MVADNCEVLEPDRPLSVGHKCSNSTVVSTVTWLAGCFALSCCCWRQWERALRELIGMALITKEVERLQMVLYHFEIHQELDRNCQ